jgi:hypothetical protein
MDDSALLAEAKFVVPQIAMASTDMHSSKIIGEDIGVHQLDVAIVISPSNRMVIVNDLNSRL